MELDRAAARLARQRGSELIDWLEIWNVECCAIIINNK